MARKGSALRRMQRKEATDDKVPDTPRSLAHSFRIQMPPRGRTVERRCLSSSGGAFAFLSHGNEEPAVAAAWQREEDGEGTDLACLISSLWSSGPTDRSSCARGISSRLASP